MCGELLILLEDELSRLACLPSEPEPIEHSDAGAQIDCRRRKTQADSPAFLPGYSVSATVGVKASHIAYLENGYRRASLDLLLRLANE